MCDVVPAAPPFFNGQAWATLIGAILVTGGAVFTIWATSRRQRQEQLESRASEHEAKLRELYGQVFKLCYRRLNFADEIINVQMPADQLAKLRDRDLRTTDRLIESLVAISFFDHNEHRFVRTRHLYLRFIGTPKQLAADPGLGRQLRELAVTIAHELADEYEAAVERANKCKVPVRQRVAREVKDDPKQPPSP